MRCASPMLASVGAGDLNCFENGTLSITENGLTDPSCGWSSLDTVMCVASGTAEIVCFSCAPDSDASMMAVSPGVNWDDESTSSVTGEPLGCTLLLDSVTLPGPCSM